MALPLYLIGARGCGKTTVGQALARALSYDFRDTDHHLQQITQRSIAELVVAEGWAKFRQRESDALAAVTAPATVIATGGGVVLAECNRCYMREHGQVIYLNAGADVLIARLEAYPQHGQRPTLTGRPVSDEMAEVLATREALYQQTAHHIIDATSAPKSVVRHVLDVLMKVRTD